MAKSHVLSGLVAKYQEVSSAIAEHQAQIKSLQQSLSDLKGSIRLFDSEYDLRSIQPKRPYKRSTIFTHGESQRRVLEALRDAVEPYSSRNIVDKILADKGIEPNSEVVINTQKRVVSALRSLEKRHLVNQVGSDGSALLWQLA